MSTAEHPAGTAVRVITEPAVYVLGKQTVDDAELDRFLADHGVSWQSDSEVAGEVLTETAGRVCYMSFAKPRPGRERRVPAPHQGSRARVGARARRLELPASPACRGA